MLAATRPYFTGFRAPSQVKIRQKRREGYENRQTLRHPFSQLTDAPPHS